MAAIALLDCLFLILCYQAIFLFFDIFLNASGFRLFGVEVFDSKLFYYQSTLLLAGWRALRDTRKGARLNLGSPELGW